MRVGIETTNQKYMFIEDGACKRYFPIKDNKLDGDAFVQSLNSHLENQDRELAKLKADNERVREVNRLLAEALTKNNLSIQEKDEEIAKLKKHIDIWCHPSQYTQLLKHENTKQVCEKLREEIFGIYLTSGERQELFDAINRVEKGEVK